MTEKKVKKVVQQNEHDYIYDIEDYYIDECCLPFFYCRPSEVISKLRVAIFDFMEEQEWGENNYPLNIVIFDLTDMVKIKYKVENILTFSEVKE